MVKWIKHLYNLLMTEYRHLFILLYYPIFLIWFDYLEKTVTPDYFMYTPLDSALPFVPAFVIPYILWFPYIGAFVAYFALKSKRDFYKVCITMFTGMTFCLIVYMLFPNGHNLRVNLYGDDIFTRIVGFIYATDTPTNCAPSMHTLNSLLMHWVIWKSPRFKNNMLIRCGSAVLAVSICLSTVLIKQHSVIDLVLGALLAGVLYLLYSHLEAAWDRHNGHQTPDQKLRCSIS